MLWQIDYQENKKWIQEAEVKNRPLSPKLQSIVDNEPRQTGLDEFFMRSWQDLQSCRPVSFGVSPIPWDKILLYAQYKNLDAYNTEVFIQCIQEMDHGFLEYHRKKSEKENGNNVPNSSRNSSRQSKTKP